MTPDNPIAADTSPAGLDALADEIAAEWGLTPEARDTVRAKLADLENVVLHPDRGVPVRMVFHETVGDWTRITLEPWLRAVS